VEVENAWSLTSTPPVIFHSADVKHRDYFIFFLHHDHEVKFATVTFINKSFLQPHVGFKQIFQNKLGT
jgi:hypothetical protein